MVTLQRFAHEMAHCKRTLGERILEKGDVSQGVYIFIRGSMSLFYQPADPKEPKEKTDLDSKGKRVKYARLTRSKSVVLQTYEKIKLDSVFGCYFLWKEFNGLLENPRHYLQTSEYTVVVSPHAERRVERHRVLPHPQVALPPADPVRNRTRCSPGEAAAEAAAGRPAEQLPRLPAQKPHPQLAAQVRRSCHHLSRTAHQARVGWLDSDTAAVIVILESKIG